MKILFFGTNFDIIDEWKINHTISDSLSCFDFDSFTKELQNYKADIIIADYDTVAHDINKMISSNILPKNLVILERAPEITTGKMLISHGVKAYGNSRMMNNHFKQLIQAVASGKIWTYPELTAALVKTSQKVSLNDDALKLINNRLSSKEIEVVYLILDGLTNDAIGLSLVITTRTVKAHVSSILSKLHVNDRVSLVLLLK